MNFLKGFLSVWVGCWVITIFSMLVTKEAPNSHFHGPVYLIKYTGSLIEKSLEFLFAGFMILTQIFLAVLFLLTLPIWFFIVMVSDLTGITVY